MNNDGYDELFISEPYNLSAPFNSGDVWVFYGNSDGLGIQPDIRLKGNANDLLGLNFASAGDTNSDGFNDLLISRDENGLAKESRVDFRSDGDTIHGSTYLVASGFTDFGQAISNPSIQTVTDC